MATITEDYVSFETAKLLKEKGFPQSTFVCNTVYKPNGYISNNAKSFISPSYIYKDIYIFAPTLQMAMKWLREVYNLFIQLRTIPHTTATMEQKYYFFTVHKNRRILEFRKDSPSDHYATYEQACDAAIKYCLENLI